MEPGPYPCQFLSSHSTHASMKNGLLLLLMMIVYVNPLTAVIVSSYKLFLFNFLWKHVLLHGNLIFLGSRWVGDSKDNWWENLPQRISCRKSSCSKQYMHICTHVYIHISMCTPVHLYAHACIYIITVLTSNFSCLQESDGIHWVRFFSARRPCHHLDTFLQKAEN